MKIRRPTMSTCHSSFGTVKMSCWPPAASELFLKTIGSRVRLRRFLPYENEEPFVCCKGYRALQRILPQGSGLRTIADLGANAVLTGGLSLQTEESWKQFTGKPISYCANDAEIYFEEDDFDAFSEKLGTIPALEYVHPVMTHAWGQRVVRFYDPDHHIIEVGEI